MWLHQKIELEEQERERQYLESIGPIGRLIDNHWTYVLLMVLLLLFGWSIGLGIGLIFYH